MILSEARWSGGRSGHRAFVMESAAQDVTLADIIKLAQEHNVRPEDVTLSSDCHYPGTDDPGYYIEASWETG